MPRSIEIIIAVLATLVLLPLLLLLGFLLRGYDDGPALYRARRVGKGGKEFTLYKFRTMVVDAALRGPALTTESDWRITPIGRILRRTKCDELPQLLNVLKGDMSFVGPRPEDPRYVALYSPEQRKVLDLRPGVTSPASLHYRDESSLLTGPDAQEKYVHQILPHKLAIELEYRHQKSAWTDVVIVLRTIRAMFI